MFVDQCIEGNPLSDTCEEATFDDSNAEISGSVTINDDGSYTSDTETSGTVRSTLPASCFEGVPVSSCDDLDNPDEGFDCSGDIEQACDCVTELSDSSTASGTWRTEDTTLFLNEGTQNESQAQYCVEGDVFRFQTVQGDAMATTVLTR